MIVRVTAPQQRGFLDVPAPMPEASHAGSQRLDNSAKQVLLFSQISGEA